MAILNGKKIWLNFRHFFALLCPVLLIQHDELQKYNNVFAIKPTNSDK